MTVRTVTFTFFCAAKPCNPQGSQRLRKHEGPQASSPAPSRKATSTGLPVVLISLTSCSSSSSATDSGMRWDHTTSYTGLLGGSKPPVAAARASSRVSRGADSSRPQAVCSSAACAAAAQLQRTARVFQGLQDAAATAEDAARGLVLGLLLRLLLLPAELKGTGPSLLGAGCCVESATERRAAEAAAASADDGLMADEGQQVSSRWCL